MRQLSLFEQKTEEREANPTPQPSLVGVYREILGVRYSPDPVTGWCAVKNLEIKTNRNLPLRGYSLIKPTTIPLEEGVAWVDPETIDVVLCNGGGPRGIDDPTIFWGFGQRYSVKHGCPIDHTYNGGRERVSFDFIDIDNWRLAWEARQRT